MHKRLPLTNDEGDFIRELSDEDLPWFVRNEDFASLEDMHDFLRRREDMLEQAEALGIPREAFLAFDPSRPGFEQRAAAAFRAFTDTLAAE